MQSSAIVNIKVDNNGLTALTNSLHAQQNTTISIDSNMVTSTETSSVAIKLDQNAKLNSNQIVVLSIENTSIANANISQTNSSLLNKSLTMQKVSQNNQGNTQFPMQIVTQLIAQQNVSSPSGGGRTAIVHASPQQQSLNTQVQVSNVSGGQIIQRVPSTNLRTLAPRMTAISSSSQQAIIKGPISNQQLTMGSVTIGNNTVLPGFVLMKNEQGQLVIVQQSQISTTCSPVVQQLRTPVLRPSIVIQQPQQQQQTINNLQVSGTLPRQQNLVRIPLQTHAPSTASHNQLINNVNKDILDNVRKCKNFLSTLLKLAANQPEETVRNVRKLIQDLVDNVIVPEYFTSQLQKELKSSPQPYLIPFLKKSLPFLRQHLSSNKMHIEGIRPPIIVTTSNVSSNINTTIASLSNSTIAASSSLPHNIHSGAATTSSSTFAQPLHVIQSRSATAAVHLTQEQLQQRLQMTQNAIEAQRRRLPLAMVSHQRMTFDASQQQRPQLMVNSGLGGAGLSSLLTSSSTACNISTYNNNNNTNAHLSSTSNISVSGGVRPEKRKYDVIRDDDDINDVATMGGVNLSEESRNILAPTNQLATIKPRSCKDEKFLDSALLLDRIKNLVLKFGIKTIQPEVMNLISHAAEEKLRSILEKLSTATEHRMKIYKNDPHFELLSEPKRQIKFQQEVESIEGERQKELENQAIQRAAKSRSKTEDPDQLRKKKKVPTATLR